MMDLQKIQAEMTRMSHHLLKPVVVAVAVKGIATNPRIIASTTWPNVLGDDFGKPYTTALIQLSIPEKGSISLPFI